ncbi:MAG TPA: tetratricopeptide repeat protein [Polymorphobacter sp.]|nr:tetratricopeptide repeat protein [Polymorphobacter sp.]
MKKFTTPTFKALAISALLATTGVVAGVAVPAQAADKPAAPKYKLSKPVQQALAESQKLSAAGDNAGALAKVNEAAALPSLTPDEIYMINAVKINIAIATKDNTLLEQALRGALSSGMVPPDDQAKFYRNLGALALQHNDYASATSDFEKLAALNPADTEPQIALAELYQRQKQPVKAVAMLTKVIETAKANGTVAPETVYRRRLAIAYDAKLAADIQPAAMALVAAYPNPVNWRDALTIFRDGANLDDQASLDTLRLMATVGALNGERDYAVYAETASNRGLPGEAKTALDEGVAKGMLSTSKPFVKELSGVVNPKIAADKASLPGLAKDAAKAANGKLALSTGDAMYGYGQYADAAAMYKLAMSKGGIDADTANLRLGMVLAKSGDKAGAEAAFKAVAGPGARKTLAQYWLIWLSKKA